MKLVVRKIYIPNYDLIKMALNIITDITNFCRKQSKLFITPKLHGLHLLCKSSNLAYSMCICNIFYIDYIQIHLILMLTAYDAAELLNPFDRNKCTGWKIEEYHIRNPYTHKAKFKSDLNSHKFQ